MHQVGIVGPDDGVASLREAIVSALADRGTVATVAREDGGRSQSSDAAERHRFGPDGAWQASASDRDLDDVLDDLATRVDYAVLTGWPEADVPTVALADHDHAGEAIATAPDAAAVDLADCVAAIEATEPRETLHSLVAKIKRSPEAEFSGAIATFTGRVRTRENESDTATEYLAFQKYEGVAESKFAAICEDLEARDGVFEVRMHHETGVVPAGDDVVHVVVLAGHRPEAFRAVEDGIDRLKAEVPLFKKEVTVDDEFWAHQRE
jgi:molybdopterin synthase catalytic subunit